MNFVGRWRAGVTFGIVLIGWQTSHAADPGTNEAAVRAAIAKSLPLLLLGAKTSLAERKECFTCHNQGLPIMALATARSKGFAVDEDELQRQLQFTADFLAKNRERYREGRGQAGQTFMAGYAAWALHFGKWPADETTTAVAEYFLIHQQDRDHWSSHTDRPPSESSDFTANFLGLQTLAAFATDAQQERAAARRQQVRDWLVNAEPSDTEDRVFRLRGLSLAEAPEAVLFAATENLLKTQRADGGWSQMDSLDSDAYATATALLALHEAGGLPTTAKAYARGAAFLLQLQKDDGSWHVVSRSKPFQTYYESGYPHGTDQFLSITAGGWATLALLATLADTAAPVVRP